MNRVVIHWLYLNRSGAFCKQEGTRLAIYDIRRSTLARFHQATVRMYNPKWQQSLSQMRVFAVPYRGIDALSCWRIGPPMPATGCCRLLFVSERRQKQLGAKADSIRASDFWWASRGPRWSPRLVETCSLARKEIRLDESQSVPNP